MDQIRNGCNDNSVVRLEPVEGCEQNFRTSMAWNPLALIFFIWSSQVLLEWKSSSRNLVESSEGRVAPLRGKE